MVNKVILVGRLGKDPEVRHFEGGSVVANFPIATDEVYNDRSGERQKKTEWHNIAVWRKNAEIAEKYLRKGSMIYLEGKLRTRTWDDKEGNKRYSVEVHADFFRMLESRKDENQSGQNAEPNNYSQNSPQMDHAKESNPSSQPMQTQSVQTGPDDQTDDLPF